MTATCHARTAVACSDDVIPVRILQGRRSTDPVRWRTTACAACRAAAANLGMNMVDDRPDVHPDVRPEWRRRLGARDETGAVLHPEAVR